MKKIILGFLFALTILITACSQKGSNNVENLDGEKKVSLEAIADTVVYGPIYTAEDENDGMAEAFAVKDGKFIYVGTKEGAAAYIKEGVTKVINSGDGLVIPGCTEAHGHFLGIDAIMRLLPGYNMKYPDLLDLLKEKMNAPDQEKPKKFITWGWAKESVTFHDGKGKTFAEEIEEVAPGIPVVFVDEGGHAAVCSKTALKMADLWDEQNVRGGEAELTEKGEPTGYISDELVPYVIEKAIGTPIEKEQYKTACYNAVNELHRRGFTNYMDGYINYLDDSTVYQYINELDKANDLNINMSTCYAIRSFEDKNYKEKIDHAAELADKYNSPHFDSRIIKLFADGVVEESTGWILDEYLYEDEERKHGNKVWSQEELDNIVEYANEKNVLVHTHAYGDGACNAILNSYIKSNEKFDKKFHNSIAHARNITEEDKKRAAENDIGIAENLIWHHLDPREEENRELVDSIFPREIVDKGYPMKSLLENGVKMSSSTDAPCSEVTEGNIMNIIEVAVTGIRPELDINPYWPEELITIKDALKALTINGAWQLGIDDKCGSIKVGKNADFVILDKNILNYQGDDLRKIHNVNVVSTYFEGKEVYKLKADYKIKNAKVFTSDNKTQYVTSFAVKDGKFIYVGDEKGLENYDGEVKDLEGKFITPALMDSHVHITVSVANQYTPAFEFISEMGKTDILKHISDFVNEHKDQEKYNFMVGIENLGEEKLTKEDLDAICSDKNVLVVEHGFHSVWCNTKLLTEEGISDATKDIVPDLSYYERDENGHITGYLVEMTEGKIIMSHTSNITDEEIRKSVEGYLEFCQKNGISAVFDAGLPGADEFHERVYKILCDMDREGKLPITIEGSYLAYTPDMLDGALEKLKKYREEYNTEHFKVNTLKIISDGTIGIYTAAMVDPYVGKTTRGGLVFDTDRLVALLKELNDNNFDIHIHTVGDRASKTVLDSVEKVKSELGEDFKTQVTCAHLEIMKDEDLGRFNELGVIANYTPWWHGGAGGGGGLEGQAEVMGMERASNMYKCRTVYDTGATVAFSSDNVAFGEFLEWNPYLGMEIAMTRFDSKNTKLPDTEYFDNPYPPLSECMEIDQVLNAYTINNAKQLRLDDKKGSIEVGKDADFLVFDKDLTTAEKEGFSYTEPSEVYFEGKKVN